MIFILFTSKIKNECLKTINSISNGLNYWWGIVTKNLPLLESVNIFYRIVLVLFFGGIGAIFHYLDLIKLHNISIASYFAAIAIAASIYANEPKKQNFDFLQKLLLNEISGLSATVSLAAIYFKTTIALIIFVLFAIFGILNILELSKLIKSASITIKTTTHISKFTIILFTYFSTIFVMHALKS